MARKLTALETAGIVLLAALTVFLTWRIKAIENGLAGEHNPTALRNRQAPEFSLRALDGRRISLSDYKGKKKLVISYWASWCGPCRMEMPSLRSFYQNYHKPDSNFELLAISIDEDRSQAESFAREERLPFPVLLDPDSRAADAYSVGAIPALFVVEKDGRVSYAATGAEDMLEFRLAAQLGIEIEHRAPARDVEDHGDTGD
jgi:peroxiredoxin